MVTLGLVIWNKAYADINDNGVFAIVFADGGATITDIKINGVPHEFAGTGYGGYKYTDEEEIVDATVTVKQVQNCARVCVGLVGFYY
jgi:hypothetical protein